MALVREELLAMPARSAARLAGISERRLTGWAARELVTPSVNRRLSERNTVRLYDFQDLLEILIVRELIDRGVHARTIGGLVDHLRRHYDRPLTEVRWAVDGKRVYVQHWDGTWVGDRAPDQMVFWQLLELDPLRARIRDAIERGRMEEDQGNVVKRRGVMGSKPVFAGTRVPVEAVQAYLRRNASDKRILEAFPQLSKADIDAARDAMSAA
ncbi:MAG: DUF433 domain-containing protein [Actinomycetes bacterium]